MSFRPPSSSARRPGSSLRPGSAYNRPMTGFRRLDTANGQAPNGSSVGLATDINVQARPLTKHGITGMTATNQNKRKVADRTYYENQLKQKLNEIISEISSLENKINVNNINKEQIGKLEKDRNILMSQVRELEGQLADYNLALDKMRSGANINELKDACNQIKQRNDREKNNLDSIYLEKKSIEQEIENNYKYITQLHENIESRLKQNNNNNSNNDSHNNNPNQNLDDINQISENINDINSENVNNNNNNNDNDIAKQYRQLLKESRDIDMLTSEKEKQLSEIQHKYNNIREQLHSSDKYTNNITSLEYEKQISRLNNRKKELTLELNDSSNMDSEEIKRNILESVKKNNNILNNTKREINNIEIRIEEYNLTLVQKERDLETMKHNASKSDQFEKLYESEKKMNNFINTYNDTYNNILIKKKEIENNIIGLMKHISMINNNISKEDRIKNFNKLSNDLNFKLEQKKQSENTLQHIIKEKQDAQKYLERIENLDKKIPSEIEKLENDKKDMEIEISQFKTNNEIQEYFKLEKIKLFKKKNVISTRKRKNGKKII